MPSILPSDKFFFMLSSYIACAIVPMLCLIFGGMHYDVMCVSNCQLQECDLPENKPYILPTPPIGINLSWALIGAGIIGEVLVASFVIFLFNRDAESIWNYKLLIPTIPYFASIAWLIASFIVYKQTINECKEYNDSWHVDSIALYYLLGASIIGMFVLIAPYAIPFISAAIILPYRIYIANKKNCNWFKVLCPCAHSFENFINFSETYGVVDTNKTEPRVVLESIV